MQNQVPSWAMDTGNCNIAERLTEQHGRCHRSACCRPTAIHSVFSDAGAIPHRLLPVSEYPARARCIHHRGRGIAAPLDTRQGRRDRREVGIVGLAPDRCRWEGRGHVAGAHRASAGAMAWFGKRDKLPTPARGADAYRKE
ncbi:hypothetical protein BC834DRAFT_304189 [Gloeopeniophorella convolvens]|nr:hypothetical protein BC834DRAFT_304189 [Gloeopeniophorella convolvens]